MQQRAKETGRWMFSFCQMTDESFLVLSQKIFDDPKITELDLSLNLLTDESVPLLVEILKSTDTLTDLNLSENHLTTAGLVQLREGLKHNTSLTELKCVSQHLHYDGALLKVNQEAYRQHLFPLLKRNRQMHEEVRRKARSACRATSLCWHRGNHATGKKRKRNDLTGVPRDVIKLLCQPRVGYIWNATVAHEKEEALKKRRKEDQAQTSSLCPIM